jgi:hypothetical protein
MLRRKLRLKIILKRGTRKKLAPTSSKKTMARIRESLSNLLLMLNKILPSRRRRRKTKQSYLTSCVESLVILLKIVRSERTRKKKRKSTL